MAYAFQIFTCKHGCPDTFWTVNELYAHHFEQHERPLPAVVHRPTVPPPPPGGVAPTALEIARAGFEAVKLNGTRSHKD
ncbi:MAG TPA: hypothetical protein VF077_12535 [Nitrospiraceae bacterium]